MAATTGKPENAGPVRPSGFLARSPLAVCAALDLLGGQLWADVAEALDRSPDSGTVWVQPVFDNGWEQVARVSSLFIEDGQRQRSVRGLMEDTADIAKAVVPPLLAEARKIRLGRAGLLTDLDVSTLWLTRLLATACAAGRPVRLVGMPVITGEPEGVKQELAPGDLLLLTDVLPTTVAFTARRRRWRHSRREPFGGVAQWLLLGADGLIRAGGVSTHAVAEA